MDLPDRPRVDLGVLGADALGERLESVRHEQTRWEQVAASAAEATGTGESEDGRVRAVVKADGTLVDLTIEPRVLRGGSVEVTEAVKHAVNAAGAAARERLAEIVSEGGDRSARQMAEDLRAGLDDVVNQVLGSIENVQSRLR